MFALQAEYEEIPIRINEVRGPWVGLAGWALCVRAQTPGPGWQAMFGSWASCVSADMLSHAPPPRPYPSPCCLRSTPPPSL